jgi:hypothetical protein
METVFQLAQDSKGCYSDVGEDKSIWYDGESPDLCIQLLFSTIDDANNFQNGLSSFRFDHPKNITFERDIVKVYLAVPPRLLLFDDYKPEYNSERALQYPMGVQCLGGAHPSQSEMAPSTGNP